MSVNVRNDYAHRVVYIFAREILCGFRKRSMFSCADFSRNHHEHYRLGRIGDLQARAAFSNAKRASGFPGKTLFPAISKMVHSALIFCRWTRSGVTMQIEDTRLTRIAETRRLSSGSAITLSRFRYSDLNYGLFGLIRWKECRDERLSSRFFRAERYQITRNSQHCAIRANLPFHCVSRDVRVGNRVCARTCVSNLLCSDTQIYIYIYIYI